MNLSFPDSTYSSSNKPSTATLKAYIQTIETDFNAHVADATLHFLASTVWPVGSVYIAVVSTNPATLLGFGTWSAFAAGKTLIGLNSGDTDFDTVEETGGAKTHIHTGTTAAPSGDTEFVNLGDENASINGDAHTHAFTTTAGSTLPPYIVTYMWKRTA